MNHRKELNMPQMQAGGTSAPPAGKRVQRAWLAALLLAATSAVTPARAGDEESERANLARIESELAQIQQMVAAAAKDAPPAQRVNFRYEWLIGDIDVMRRGIQQHMNAPRQPRPVEPLRGDYRN